jgi:hypothetical protein
MKIIQFFLSLIFLGIIILILICGYLGLIPILSETLGATYKDLGVKYDQLDYQNFIKKAQTEMIPLKKIMPYKESLIYDGKKDLNESFSQEEISARINYSLWKYMPFKKVQVRINDDNTVEVSTLILIDRLPGFLAQAGLEKYTLPIFFKKIEFIEKLITNPPLYIKFTAGISNNILNINLQKITIGKLNFPLMRFGVNQLISLAFANFISKVPNFYAKNVIFAKEQMIFQGTVPEKELVEVTF